ncbi:MAG: efflux RND transporter periplasmic adaptor subunit [Planctomycetota bacterium]
MKYGPLVGMVVVGALLGAQGPNPVRGSAAAAADDPRDPRSWTGISLPSRRVVVGAEENGRIVELAVRDGQSVEAGELLFQLDASVVEAEVERLRLRASSDVGLRDAQQRHAQAEREVLRLRSLRRQSIASGGDADAAEHEFALARIAVDRAVLEREMVAAELRQAERRLARYFVLSPLSGVVERRVRQAGETVERLTAVVEIVGIDELWVEFDCGVAQLEQFPRGGEAMVRPAFGDAAARRATVIHRSVSADPASQTRRVRLLVRNDRRDWRPGYKMVISADPDAVVDRRQRQGEGHAAAPR